ncbi:MAG: glucose-6-phosphate isomerase [Oscillospiraceae bacterium]|nr:glucose-6-phosphate isomerase [Oscillospiraceae bacterium]
MIKVDIQAVSPFLPPNFCSEQEAALNAAHAHLTSGTGVGAEFTGWVRLPALYDRAEFARLKAAAHKIQSDSQVLVVIGIGGSYLGARAVIELLRSPNYNLKQKDTPDIFFAGNSLSTDALLELLELIGDRDFSINVISKSGTTTEPAVAFRVLKGRLEQKYGTEGAKDRIYATTDKEKGALKHLADGAGYETFTVPDEIGGRYSVLTAVGLLPIAAAGIDIDALMVGAEAMMRRCLIPGEENPAWQYAAARHTLYQSGKSIELLACYEPSFRMFAEWWKQLYGESEGKQGRGLFPASAEFTADLHSMGQYIQEGQRLLFETVVHFAAPLGRYSIPYDESDGDGLNFLAGRELAFVNEQALRGTLLAHLDGGVPGIVLTVPNRTEACAGELIYFFEFACGLSGYLLGVNPFDQPGVEAYKRNMFALLGKPGFEEQRAKLEARFFS